jgi:hypothetical protein
LPISIACPPRSLTLVNPAIDVSRAERASRAPAKWQWQSQRPGMRTGAGNMACVCVFGGEGRGGAYEDDFAGFEDGGGVVERGSSAGDENVGVDDCGGVSLLVGDAVAM